MPARKIGTWALGLHALVAAFVASCAFLLLPAAGNQQRRKLATPGDIATIDDAVAACRRTGLEGWPLVTFAQQLVYNQFRTYGDVRTACAGRAGNLPGRVNFTPLAPAWRDRAPVLLLSHFGMILFCGYLEWCAVLTGQPLPEWMFVPRSDTAG